MAEQTEHAGPVAESLRAFREVFRNPALRRLELAWAGSSLGNWAFDIVLAVYAFDAGGATAVGVVAAARMLPAALAAPFTSLLADRVSRERVLVLTELARALTIAAVTVNVALDGPAGAVYGLAVVYTIIATAFRPAMTAVLPALARTPAELTASNVASTTIDNLGFLAGSAVGGVLLAATSTELAFAVTAGAFVWSTLMAARVRVPERLVVTDEGAAPAPASAAAGAPGTASEALAGFRLLLGDRELRLLAGLLGALTLVEGIYGVLTVAAAFDLLDMGGAGVGYLNSAWGAGGAAGGLAVLILLGRRRLAAGLGAGCLLVGLPFALIGIIPVPAMAIAMLVVVGLGYTLVEVAGYTLLQRLASDEVLARVFGVLESAFVATVGIGSLIAPVLISTLGIKPALIAAGAFLPLLALVYWRRLAGYEAGAPVPGREFDLLRAVPLFHPLPLAMVEHLARSLKPFSAGSGQEVITEGDHGDRFFVIDEGEVEVIESGVRKREQGPGEHFGEIALLRDVRRTATVRALTPVKLLSLDREEFIAAVTGHARSAEAADAVIGARLGSGRVV